MTSFDVLFCMYYVWKQFNIIIQYIHKHYLINFINAININKYIRVVIVSLSIDQCIQPIIDLISRAWIYMY